MQRECPSKAALTSSVVHHWEMLSSLTQLSVLTVPPGFLTSFGTLPELRGQNQTLMKLLLRSIVYHPPPLPLNDGP